MQWYFALFEIQAGVAQLVEQLICNQQVAGSSPIASSIRGGTTGDKNFAPVAHRVSANRGFSHGDGVRQKRGAGQSRTA